MCVRCFYSGSFSFGLPSEIPKEKVHSWKNTPLERSVDGVAKVSNKNPSKHSSVKKSNLPSHKSSNRESEEISEQKLSTYSSDPSQESSEEIKAQPKRFQNEEIAIPTEPASEEINKLIQTTIELSFKAATSGLSVR